MNFEHIELPEPLQVRLAHSRVPLPWVVTDRGKVIAAFETEGRARAYAGRLNQVMTRTK